MFPEEAAQAVQILGAKAAMPIHWGAFALAKHPWDAPFVIGVRAGEVLPETDSEDMVLVQGIMDAFYETEDGIVLLDYKTDHLEAGQEDVLAGRYRMQMDLYARALEGILKKKVVRKVLYSFSLSEEITV